ncbi:GntR family transcriptional regulator [Streptomyces flavochromogenes]|uniref:GntR family transcriptional regulator n=1 Tax=Streptomyces flavochromogenes TaxID=68199 RepID=A0ABW6XN67_9ACTN
MNERGKDSFVAHANPRGTFLVVSESLKGEIDGKDEGSSLPSESTLMEMYGVSRNTVRRALKELEKEGLIASVPGLGWRVSKHPVKPLLERLIDAMVDDELAVGDAFPSEAALSTRFRTSRTSVRRALAQMEGSGLLLTVHGKGRTVRALPDADRQS